MVAVLDAGWDLPQIALQLFHFAERVLFAGKLRRVFVARGVREAAFQRGIAEHFDECGVELRLTLGIGRRSICRFGGTRKCTCE